jgi:hypothetical protein
MLNRKPLDDVLELGITDHPFIRHSFDSKKDFLKENQHISKKLLALITEASANPELEQLCKDASYDNPWNTIYNEIAAYFTNEKNSSEEISLTITYEQPGIPCFDLMRGIYFFYQSQTQKIHNDAKEEKTIDRLSLLEKAIQYRSIHAMQYHHEVCYQEIETDTTNAPILFKEIIQNCNSILPFYGSFAYVMLAEAYCRYAYWSSKNNDLTAATTHFQSARTCCNYAEKYFTASKFSIHNASFGKGLKASNSLGLETIEGLKNYIKEAIHRIIFSADSSPSNKDEKPSISLSPRCR